MLHALPITRFCHKDHICCFMLLVLIPNIVVVVVHLVHIFLLNIRWSCLGRPRSHGQYVGAR